MSINSAMLAGVSGLVTNSSALAAISDNIANVNTVAYKRSQVNFATQVTAQVAGRYSAGGVQGQTRQFVSQQGLIQSATSPTDLAISGEGFFITTLKPTGVAPGDARLFTRSGSFSVDAEGYLVNDAKLYLQGWAVRPDGTYDINPSDVNKLSAINVKNLGAAVAPTSRVDISANLNKTGAIASNIATYDGSAGATSMTAYAANPATGRAPDFTVEMNVIDSAGGSHKFAMSFLKAAAATPNTWHAEVYALPAADVTTAAAPAPQGQIARGVVVFNADGTINTASTTLPATLSLGASTAATVPRWAAAMGIAEQSIALNLSNLTQFSSPSTVNAVNSDGATVGSVVGVQVDDSGVVSAIFDNSQVRSIAKIAIGAFSNADGLRSVSGNAYRSSAASGQLMIKEPGVNAGRIAPSSLEASAVDLSAEFTGLITTQKAYSASSKIISTADQMLEELINIKR
jgi:flagellar hook protein FlgE